MRSLVLTMALLASVAAFGEEDAAVRQPAKVLDVDSALADALAEKQQSSREEDDRSVSRATREEQPKIYIELGDES